jgi:small conductance mechanosensitive channel
MRGSPIVDSILRTLCVLVLLVSSSAFADPQAEGAAGRSTDSAIDSATSDEPSKASASKQAQTESEKALARFEALREKRLERLRESAALEADAKEAVGDDQVALREQALELRLAGTGTFLEMGELIEQMEARDEDAAAQRRVLIGLLPALEASIQTDYGTQSTELDRLKSERAEISGADAGALTRIDEAIVRQRDLLMRILASGVDVAELEDAVGLPTERQRGWLEERVRTRARLAASHVELAARRLEDVVGRGSAAGDPAAQEVDEAAAKQRLASSVEALESAVELMERLELDASMYRQMLVASTGELTVEAIDREVAGELISSWISGVRESAAENGPRIAFQALLFAIIVSIFWGLSRFVRKVVARAVAAPHLRFSELLKRMIVSLSSGLVLLLGLLVALSQLGIEVAPMLAGLGIAGFVLGFALQDTLGNFAAGIMILIYRPYDVGDMIDCAGGVFGKVSHMSLVATTILTIDNKTLIVPNSKIWGDVITNVAAQAIRRVDLEFGIGYSDDIPKAEAVLTSVIEDHPKVLADPEPVVKVHSLGDSSVNFVVRPWVARDDYWDVYWDVTREVKLRFDREGVSIPFPQRDVHVYPARSPEEPSRTDSDEAMEIGSTSARAQDEPDT